MIARTFVWALGIIARCIRMAFVHFNGMSLAAVVNVWERTYTVKTEIEDLVIGQIRSEKNTQWSLLDSTYSFLSPKVFVKKSGTLFKRSLKKEKRIWCSFLSFIIHFVVDFKSYAGSSRWRFFFSALKSAILKCSINALSGIAGSTCCRVSCNFRSSATCTVCERNCDTAAHITSYEWTRLNGAAL